MLHSCRASSWPTLSVEPNECISQSLCKLHFSQLPLQWWYQADLWTVLSPNGTMSSATQAKKWDQCTSKTQAAFKLPMRAIWCMVLALQSNVTNVCTMNSESHCYGCRHHVWEQPFQSTQPGMFQRSVGNIKSGVGEMFLPLCSSVLAGADSLPIHSEDKSWVQTVSFIKPSAITKSPAAQKWTGSGGFLLALSNSAQAKFLHCALGNIHMFVFKWATGPRDALIMDTQLICV